MEKVEQDVKGSDANTAKRKAAQNSDGVDFESESEEYGWWNCLRFLFATFC